MPNEPANITRLIALRPLLRHNSGMHVSVIVTVYNERSQHRAPSRFAGPADAPPRRDRDLRRRQQRRHGRTDPPISARTMPMLYPPLRLLVEPGANISRGRNLAIAAAQGPVIAATDAGVRLADDWLEHLVAAWDRAVDEAGRAVGCGRLFSARYRRRLPDGHVGHRAAAGGRHRSEHVSAQQPLGGVHQAGLGKRRRLSRMARLLRGSAL